MTKKKQTREDVRRTVRQLVGGAFKPEAGEPLPPTPRPFGFDDIVRAYADRIVESRARAVYASRPDVEAHVREAIQAALDRKDKSPAAQVKKTGDEG